MSWRPSAAYSMLKARASLVAGLRQFLSGRGSLEVDVPAISAAPASDIWIDSFEIRDPDGKPQGYLLSSPETYLKRLLAVYAEPMHALVKAYRANEHGLKHATEFTMLEWYRPANKDVFATMVQDISDLVVLFTAFGAPRVVTYRELFEAQFGLNPHTVTLPELTDCAISVLGPGAIDSQNLDSMLSILFATDIEPHLVNHIVIDFPVVQASLSRVEADSFGDLVAKRAELYLLGIEIANGYYELTDVDEQQLRFINDEGRRIEFRRPMVPRDEPLLQALRHGLPESYGVALGVDRLLMVITGNQRLAKCMTFGEVQ